MDTLIQLAIGLFATPVLLFIILNIVKLFQTHKSYKLVV